MCNIKCMRPKYQCCAVGEVPQTVLASYITCYTRHVTNNFVSVTWTVSMTAVRASCMCSAEALDILMNKIKLLNAIHQCSYLYVMVAYPYDVLLSYHLGMLVSEELLPMGCSSRVLYFPAGDNTKTRSSEIFRNISMAILNDVRFNKSNRRSLQFWNTYIYICIFKYHI